MRLSDHYSVAELTTTRTDLPNLPTTAAYINGARWAVLIGEPLRVLIGEPLRVTSWFRSSTLNARVGGAPGSAHLEARAVDLVPVGMSPLELMRRLVASAIPYDRAIYEYRSGGREGAAAWVHVQIARIGRLPRRDALMSLRPGSFEAWDQAAAIRAAL